MIILRKLAKENNIFNVIKVIYKTIHIELNSFYKDQEQGKGGSSCHSYSTLYWNTSDCNKTRKINQRHTGKKMKE